MSNSNSSIKTKGYRPQKRRQWTPQRRAAQAQRMRQQKLWLKATGPKTVEGKQRVAKNALGHGLYSVAFKQQLKILRLLLRAHRTQLKTFNQRQRLP